MNRDEPQWQTCPACRQRRAVWNTEFRVLVCGNPGCRRLFTQREYDEALNAARKFFYRGRRRAIYGFGLVVAVSLLAGIVGLVSVYRFGDRGSPAPLAAPGQSLETTPRPSLVPTSSPTSTQNPTPTATSIPTPRPTPAATPRLTPTPIALIEAQLPRDVFESFYNSFYGICAEPTFDTLRISQAWGGDASTKIAFIPPAGTYFLVVVGKPGSKPWHFDSVLETSTRRYQSLHIESAVADELTDAQKWCQTGFGTIPTNTLNVDASNVVWNVYLVAPGGKEAPPQVVLEGVRGYYDLCPTVPAVSNLQVAKTWSSAEGVTGRSLNFEATAPFYFLGVKFDPIQQEWYFKSVDVTADSKKQGPFVSGKSGQRIDFSAICPSAPLLSHLDVEASGGSWTVYLILTRSN